MTPPRPVAPAPKAANPATSEESPAIQAARNALQQAGYERNRAELAYQQAVKDQGADSEAAKAAKEALDKAQANVEVLQGELRKLLKPATASKPVPLTKDGNKATAPKKVAMQAPKPTEAPKHRAEFREFGGEVLIRREFHGEVLIRELRYDSEKLLKLVEEIQKDPALGSAVLERIRRYHGESAETLLTPFRAAPEKR